MRAPLVFALFLLTACQPQRAPQPEQAPPARATPSTKPALPAQTVRVLRMELGNALDATSRVVRPMQQFSASDTLFVSIELAASNPTQPHLIGVRWSHLDSKQTVLEENRTQAIPTPTNLAFQVSKPDGWPSGQYKAEIFLDGQLAQTRLFEVGDVVANKTALPR